MLLEPTYGVVEAGCQGTLRALVRTTGRRAHTARAWRGVNAIHAAGEVLRRLADYRPRTVTIDGCTYREGLNAVRIAGGVAGNVVPDECARRGQPAVRAGPHGASRRWSTCARSSTGFDMELTDSAPGALPGLTAAPAREFLTAVGAEPAAKLGWTDVARFAALGIPALNYGPGDPLLAHAPDEHVEIGKIRDGAATLHRWLHLANRGLASGRVDRDPADRRRGVISTVASGSKGWFRVGWRQGECHPAFLDHQPDAPLHAALHLDTFVSGRHGGSSAQMPGGAGRRACAVRGLVTVQTLQSYRPLPQSGKKVRCVAILLPKPTRLFTGYGPSALPWLP